MLYFLKLLLISIHISQETVLNWFGLSDSSISGLDVERSPFLGDFSEGGDAFSIETLRLLIEGLWNKLQSGLTLSEIETLLFFVLFIRFLFLALKYNLKTSFYITCITLVAGYLWYRHLIDVILLYRHILLKLPFFHKLGQAGLDLVVIGRQNVRNDLILGENVHWYDVGQLLYYTFTKGIVDFDSSTGLKSYIDPLSMIVSNLDEPLKSNIVPYYYKIYNKIIPKIFSICSKFWTQLSGLAAYALITRIGKRYCPYLVRWHWTFLLIIGFPEQILFFFTKRVIYFQSFVLFPQLMEGYENYKTIDQSLLLEINVLNALLACIVIMHVSFVILGLFHAVCGQYFYFPFFVENAELHIGPRPKNSVYSGGYTSWQDVKNENREKLFPPIWYGWLGKQSEGNWKPVQFIFNYIRDAVRKGLRRLRKN